MIIEYISSNLTIIVIIKNLYYTKNFIITIKGLKNMGWDGILVKRPYAIGAWVETSGKDQQTNLPKNKNV